MASIYHAPNEGAYGVSSPSYNSSSSTLASSIKRHGTDSSDDKSVSSVKRKESMRLYAQSMYERETNIEEPYEVSDLEDSDEDVKIQTGIPSKANRLLGLDTSFDQPKRTTPKSHKSPLKGKSPPPDPFPIQDLPTDTENIAPKALRMLGIRSNALARPATNHRDNHALQQNAPHVPFDPDDFDRVLPSHQRTDNSSSTDASSLSRGSTLSWQTETPRSSQEVYPEESKWNHRPIESSYRQDTTINPSAVLTEPFSPVSCKTFLSSSPDNANAFVFELPAEVPASHFSNNKSHFIAELPAATLDEVPIFELPALSPEIVELPAEEVVSPQSAELGHERARLPFSQRPNEKPTTSEQASGIISVAMEMAQMPPRYPATVSLLHDNGENMTRVQSCDGSVSRSRRDQVTKSRSAEFDSYRDQRPEAILSPRSRAAGLATIAVNTTTGSQKTVSTSSPPRGLVARSKYNAETVPRISTLPHESHSLLREQLDGHQEKHNVQLQPTSAVTKESPVEDYPESPVTGHLAGHPIFRSQTAPVPAGMVAGTNVIPVQLAFPNPPQRTDSPQPLPVFHHKEGYI